MLFWSAWTNIAQQNYLCNVDPQSINNFALENNLIFSGSISVNIVQRNFLCNVGPWLTGNIFEGNNAAWTILGQHWIRLLPSQYCLHAFEITLHKKTACAILIQNAQTCFRRKTGYSFKGYVACFLTGCNITEKSWRFFVSVGLEFHLRFAEQQCRGWHWLEYRQQVTTNRKFILTTFPTK